MVVKRLFHARITILLVIVVVLTMALPLSAYANALADQDVPLDRFIPAYYRDLGVDLPLDQLKIDKSFVREMLHSRSNEAIVQSTINLAHNLGLRVVAEGVEDRATYVRLHELGCDSAQGFWMSKPLDAANAMEFIPQIRLA